jgi:Uma2 family endonuclease
MGMCWYALDMAATSSAPSAQALVQPLESGDRLGAVEFLRRYESMPEVKKAELIEGTVYLPSPVRLAHAAPNSLIQAWLGSYAARTPGTQAAGNVTVRLDAENVPQPDALLRILPECGGRTELDPAGYLFGPPELIVEVAASSVAIDLHDKLRAYRRAGVREYLVWRALEGQLDWFVLDEDEYRSNAHAGQGVLRSPHFPGLLLAVDALLEHDAAKVLDILQTGLQTPAHAAFVAQLSAKRK